MIVRALDMLLGLLSALWGVWLLVVMVTKTADILANDWETYVFTLMFLAIIASGLRLTARGMRP